MHNILVTKFLIALNWGGLFRRITHIAKDILFMVMLCRTCYCLRVLFLHYLNLQSLQIYRARQEILHPYEAPSGPWGISWCKRPVSIYPPNNKLGGLYSPIWRTRCFAPYAPFWQGYLLHFHFEHLRGAFLGIQTFNSSLLIFEHSLVQVNFRSVLILSRNDCT